MKSVFRPQQMRASGWSRRPASRLGWASLNTVTLLGALTALSTITALGCSDEPATPAVASSPALTEACSAIATARCLTIESCCAESDPPPKVGAACIDAATAACEKEYADAASAMGAGKAHVSDDRVTACKAAITAGKSACLPPAPDEVAASCGALVIDDAAVGQPCAASGLACAAGTARCRSAGGKTPMCTAFAALGADCAAAHCKPPLRCVTDKSGKKRCADQGKEGAACGQSGDCAVGLACSATKTCAPGTGGGTACTGPGTCAAGFACDDTQGKCVPQVKLGAACLAHRHCLPGLVCGGLGLKGACVSQQAIGAACQQDSDCAASLHCSLASQTCVPKASAGETCLGAESCGPLLYCDVTSKQCMTLPGEGAACAFNVKTCQPGLTCYQPSKKDRTCVKLRNEGQACSQQNNCKAGLGCQKGLCVPLPANGKTCLDKMYCADGWCDHEDNRCKAWLGAGKACKGGHECGPDGACVGTKASNLVCEPLPGKGDACLLSCKTGLFCAVSKTPGLCQPAICVIGG
ncbi:MAG: hypothetical protein KC502_15095 [Myxococcales bacterium]|nr:hypothetical protein [Myxococcales bacterium]